MQALSLLISRGVVPGFRVRAAHRLRYWASARRYLPRHTLCSARYHGCGLTCRHTRFSVNSRRRNRTQLTAFAVQFVLGRWARVS
eukprot:338108-Rhodomonas_salina.1